MKTLEYYRRELEQLFKSSGAFLRTDRGNTLFVTDAPRRGHVPDLGSGYSSLIENGLLKITPVYADVPKTLHDFYTEYLKSDSENKDRLVRQTLAVTLRNRNTAETKFLEDLLYEPTAKHNEINI